MLGIHSVDEFEISKQILKPKYYSERNLRSCKFPFLYFQEHQTHFLSRTVKYLRKSPSYTQHFVVSSSISKRITPRRSTALGKIVFVLK